MKEKIAILQGLDLDRYIALAFSFDDADNTEAEQMEAEHEKPYRALYEALTAGRISAFSFRPNHSSERYNWHIMTRSTRPGVLVQASTILVDGDDLLPLSHKDVNSFKDFSEVIPQSAAEVSWIPAA